MGRDRTSGPCILLLPSQQPRVNHPEPPRPPLRIHQGENKLPGAGMIFLTTARSRAPLSSLARGEEARSAPYSLCMGFCQTFRK